MLRNSVCVVIPARYGSKRLPGKPLIHLAGRPLILHVLDRAKEIPGVDEVIVATDDPRIAEVVERAGETAVMTPENLASGSDRVGWVCRQRDDDIVVNLQGDEPLIDGQAVHSAVRSLQQDPALMVATLGFPLNKAKSWKDPNIVKVVTDANQFALYFTRQPVPCFRDDEFRPLPVLFQHLGVYIYRREFLLQYLDWEMAPLEKAEKLEQLRILHKGYRIKVVKTVFPSFGVDTPQDIIRVEEMLKQKGYHRD